MHASEQPIQTETPRSALSLWSAAVGARALFDQEDADAGTAVADAPAEAETAGATEAPDASDPGDEAVETEAATETDAQAATEARAAAPATPDYAALLERWAAQSPTTPAAPGAQPVAGAPAPAAAAGVPGGTPAPADPAPYVKLVGEAKAAIEKAKADGNIDPETADAAFTPLLSVVEALTTALGAQERQWAELREHQARTAEQNVQQFVYGELDALSREGIKELAVFADPQKRGTPEARELGAKITKGAIALARFMADQGQPISDKDAVRGAATMLLKKPADKGAAVAAVRGEVKARSRQITMPAGGAGGGARKGGAAAAQDDPYAEAKAAAREAQEALAGR